MTTKLCVLIKTVIIIIIIIILENTVEKKNRKQPHWALHTCVRV